MHGFPTPLVCSARRPSPESSSSSAEPVPVCSRPPRTPAEAVAADDVEDDVENRDDDLRVWCTAVSESPKGACRQRGTYCDDGGDDNH